MGILLVPGSGLAAVLGEAVSPSPLVVTPEETAEVVQSGLPEVASGESEQTLPLVPDVPEVTPQPVILFLLLLCFFVFSWRWA